LIELTSGRTAYIPERTWSALAPEAKLACLRLVADRMWVQQEILKLATEAKLAVERRWMRLGRDVALAEIPVFKGERASAVADAVPGFWRRLAAGDGRCRHGASADGCRVASCMHQWRPPPPPADRYFTGELRTRILERDGYRCQYCGKRVFNDYPPDHPDRANIDHATPYPVGPTTFENGKTSCTVCNALKGNSDEFPVVASISLEELLGPVLDDPPP
jgi:5-methylcytosine-specific restriction endonuclease McrA